MKKATATLLASFYLLLSTGSLLCSFDYGGYFLFELLGKTVSQSSAQVDRMIDSHENDESDQICSYLSRSEVLKPVSSDSLDLYPAVLTLRFITVASQHFELAPEVHRLIARPIQCALPLYLKQRSLLI